MGRTSKDNELLMALSKEVLVCKVSYASPTLTPAITDVPHMVIS